MPRRCQLHDYTLNLSANILFPGREGRGEGRGRRERERPSTLILLQNDDTLVHVLKVNLSQRAEPGGYGDATLLEDGYRAASMTRWTGSPLSHRADVFDSIIIGGRAGGHGV